MLLLLNLIKVSLKLCPCLNWDFNTFIRTIQCIRLDYKGTLPPSHVHPLLLCLAVSFSLSIISQFASDGSI